MRMMYQTLVHGVSENHFIQIIKKKGWTEAIANLRKGIFLNDQDRSTLKYPLHFVSTAFDAPPEQLCIVISMLLQVQLDITNKQDKNGFTPLHLACLHALDTTCIRILLEANESSCTLLTKKGDTPLHLACQTSKTSHETIVTLLNHCTHLATLTNHMGWTPLHCAVWNDLSIPSLQAIIQSFPDALHYRTYSSKHTPLGLYWTNHSSSNLSKEEWETISLLSSHFERSTSADFSESSEAGILHRILSFPQFLPGMIESIIVSFPYEAMTPDECGRLPLHRIIGDIKFPISDILKVLLRYPEATGIADPLTGDIPLVIAITCTARSFKWREVPLEFFQLYPEAIYYRNKDKLYPYMMAAAYSSLDVCFDLLRSAPELVHP